MNSRHFEPTGPNFIHHEFTFLSSPCLKTALIFHQILVTNSTGKYMYMYSYGGNFAGQLLFVCGYWGQCEQSKASLLAKLQHAEKLKIPKSPFSVAIIIID